VHTTLALARKWRPRTFSELVGQEHVVRALSNALSQQRLHHAYLFTGTRGVGKTTLARIFAKALNCETGITAAPCGQCATCQAIDQGRYVDLLELDAASHTQVDNMRELLDNALYAPTSGRFKLYIIDEVHMLSRSAFNAMLKTLEEPPQHVKFILATTDPQKVPVTVLSRCLQFNLRPIPPPLIAGQLQRVLDDEGAAFEKGALPLLARAAQGSLRDALSLLEHAIAYGGGRVEEQGVRDMLGAVDRTHLITILKAFAAKDGATLIAAADEMAGRGLSFDSALQELADLLQKIALAQLAPSALDDEVAERDAIFEIAQVLDPESVQLFYQIAIQGRGDLAAAPDEYAGFTMTLLRMLAFFPGERAESSGEPGDRASRAESPTGGTRAYATLVPSDPKPHEGDDWSGIVASLEEGMAKMLAQHCELKSQDGNRLNLAIPREQMHLLSKTYQERLQTALEELYGAKLRVRYEIAGESENTPASRSAQAREAELARARQAVAQDPFVHTLIERCDARVIAESIKPVRSQP
jgi:DNA polymerase-3 subunit gamma/tau